MTTQEWMKEMDAALGPLPETEADHILRQRWFNKRLQQKIERLDKQIAEIEERLRNFRTQYSRTPTEYVADVIKHNEQNLRLRKDERYRAFKALQR